VAVLPAHALEVVVVGDQIPPPEMAEVPPNLSLFPPPAPKALVGGGYRRRHGTGAGADDDDVEGGLGLILCAHAGLAEMGIGPDVPAGARRSHRQSGLAQSGHGKGPV
jgi:hypothetical protein